MNRANHAKIAVVTIVGVSVGTPVIRTNPMSRAVNANVVIPSWALSSGFRVIILCRSLSV